MMKLSNGALKAKNFLVVFAIYIMYSFFFSGYSLAQVLVDEDLLAKELGQCDLRENSELAQELAYSHSGQILISAIIDRECAVLLSNNISDAGVGELVKLAGFADVYLKKLEKKKVVDTVFNDINNGDKFNYTNVNLGNVIDIVNNLDLVSKGENSNKKLFENFLASEMPKNLEAAIVNRDTFALEFVPLHLMTDAQIDEICELSSCKSVNLEELLCAEYNGVLLKYNYRFEIEKFNSFTDRCMKNEYKRFSLLRLVGVYDGRCSAVGQIEYLKREADARIESCDSYASSLSSRKLYVDVDAVYYLKYWKEFLRNDLISEEENIKNLDFISQFAGVELRNYVK